MDYLGKLLLAIERVRPWNGFAILMPEGMEYAISPMPLLNATACHHARARRQPRPRV